MGGRVVWGSGACSVCRRRHRLDSLQHAASTSSQLHALATHLVLAGFSLGGVRASDSPNSDSGRCSTERDIMRWGGGSA